MQRNYYIVNDGEIKNELIKQQEKIKENRSKIVQIVDELAKKYGCSHKEFYLNSQNSLAGVIFDTNTKPDLTLWKKNKRGGWIPKRKTIEGKENYKKMCSVHGVSLSDALPKRIPFSDCLLSIHHMHVAHCYELDGTYVISLPYDELKADSLVLLDADQIQLTFIHPWQFQKLLDEYNEKVKQEKKSLNL